MTFCSNCGADIEDYHKFCPRCGAKIVKDVQTIPESPSSHVPDSKSKDSVVAPAPIKPEIDKISSSAPPETDYSASSEEKGVFRRIDKEDFEDVTNKAKKGLGAAWKFARKGISRGAELANQGIEVAKDTIEERRTQSSEPEKVQAKEPKPHGLKYCPNCGQPISSGKYCNHCGHRLQ
jgi:ribosomal protein L32